MDSAAVTIWNGELAVFTVSCVLSAAKTMVFPIVGGLLQTHCSAAANIPAFTVSVFGLFGVLGLEHLVSGGNANTIQFPHISLNGFGNFAHTVYGPKHIAIPNPKVSVGAK